MCNPVDRGRLVSRVGEHHFAEIGGRRIACQGRLGVLDQRRADGRKFGEQLARRAFGENRTVRRSRANSVAVGGFELAPEAEPESVQFRSDCCARGGRFGWYVRGEFGKQQAPATVEYLGHFCGRGKAAGSGGETEG
jgi:hypothetical protein